MSMYKTFQTDPELEKKGVDIDYGDFIITLARAGGANKKYNQVLDRLMKPYRRAIQTETMKEEVAEDLLQQAYAEALVLNWRSKVGEDEQGERVLEQGIERPPEDPEEGLMPFNKDNVVATLKRLPDLFSDLQSQATKVAIYRSVVMEADAGN